MNKKIVLFVMLALFATALLVGCSQNRAEGYASYQGQNVPPPRVSGGGCGVAAPAQAVSVNTNSPNTAL
jgi:hypothetical protein